MASGDAIDTIYAELMARDAADRQLVLTVCQCAVCGCTRKLDAKRSTDVFGREVCSRCTVRGCADQVIARRAAELGPQKVAEGEDQYCDLCCKTGGVMTTISAGVRMLTCERCRGGKQKKG